ncbi:uncharacterized protein LOC134206295 [Armigeres subalbatus]|uniref:uncharacterized protein LOC134206295 n=1 Tax=Armigeres subalbatus TaxID=124917 RepID=UPI002ED0058A
MIITVEPLQPVIISRPGLVLETGGGTFQQRFSGKYDLNTTSSTRVKNPDSSQNAATLHPAENCSNVIAQNDAQFLCVYYQNVRGLRTKTTDVNLRLSACDYDIVVLTETWLRSDICNSDYTIFRCDRSESTSNLSRVGCANCWETTISTACFPGLVQINSISNRNSRVLDLVFTSSSDILEVSQPALPLLPTDDHHPPVLIQMDVCSFVPAQTERDPDAIDFDFRRCDCLSLNSELSTINWNQYLQAPSIDGNVVLFYDKLYEVFQLMVPRRRSDNHGISRNPWWNAELRNQRNKLRKAYKRFFANKTDENRNALRLVESSYNELLDSCYRRHLDNLQSNLKNNPSMFWKFVKSQKTSNQIPKTVNYGNATATTSDEAANLFAAFFQSVFNATSLAAGFQNVPVHEIRLPRFQFSHREVLEALCELDVSKGAGVDGLTPYLLKSGAESFATPLLLLFNQSMKDNTFPELWKTAKMIPVHKPKTWFRGSTTTNLLCYSNVLFREIERRNQVDLIYFDFSKAFDCIPHHHAVSKLRHTGFPDWVADWILSYMTGGKAYVETNSSRSKDFNIPSVFRKAGP